MESPNATILKFGIAFPLYTVYLYSLFVFFTRHFGRWARLEHRSHGDRIVERRLRQSRQVTKPAGIQSLPMTDRERRFTRRAVLAALTSGVAAAADGGLLEEWKAFARGTDGTVGATALHLPSGRLVSLNGDEEASVAASATTRSWLRSHASSTAFASLWGTGMGSNLLPMTFDSHD